ncbi:MAG TPA: hypothetical protein VIW70_11620 [Rubrivivax sp.]
MSGSKSSARAAVSDEPIGLTVHSLALPRPGADRRTLSGRFKMLLVLLACAAPVVASYFTYYVIRPEGRSNYSTLVTPTRAMPAGPWHALDGSAVDAAPLRGQWLLVSVGPSSCSGDCEKRLFIQRQLREMLGRERERLDKVWLVTDDAPLAPALRSALDAAPPVRVLRAPPAALAAWLEPAPGQALEDHLYIVDPMGEWMMRVPVDPDPARLKRDLDRLLRASSFWDQPGR